MRFAAPVIILALTKITMGEISTQTLDGLIAAVEELHFELLETRNA
eukprot:COSAG04_NODE_14848_length_553_cov_0.715859_1_plen_45_part_10